MAYAGLTVLMTWPMSVHPSLPYATVAGDFGLWLWNLWWVKKALVDLGISPYFTPYLFHPVGTSLVFHNLSPYNGLAGIPLQLLGADLISTYNLLYLSSFVIGGVGMFLLVRELVGNAFASFFAGAVYAFSPFHVITYQWTNLWTTQWLPFALLFAVRILRVGRPTDVIGLAVALVLSTLSDWHQPVFLLLTISVLTLCSALSREQPDILRSGRLARLLGGLLLYALLVSPLAYIVLKALVSRGRIPHSAVWFRQFELLGFRGFSGDLVSYVVLLGWIPSALVVYGIARGLNRWTKRFGGLLVAFFLLSLGEGLRVPGSDQPILPLPFLLWRKIPLLGIIRTSVYFWIMVQVCVAVLAGHGVKMLWGWMESRYQARWPRFRPVLGASLLGLMLIEVIQAPLTPAPLQIHPVYEAIQREGRGGAILDAPTTFSSDVWEDPHNACRSMYLQTLHGQPLVGGSTQFNSQERIQFLAQNPVLRLFLDYETPAGGNGRDEPEQLRSFLASHRVRWIVLRKEFRAPDCDRERPRGWTARKIMDLIVPAIANEELRAVWKVSSRYCGGWDERRLREADALLRRTLGPPLWDDAELVAYRVR